MRARDITEMKVSVANAIGSRAVDRDAVSGGTAQPHVRATRLRDAVGQFPDHSGV